MHKWHNIIESDRERVKHGTWIGLFTNHLLNPVIVLKNEAAFEPHCIWTTWLTLPIPIPCFRGAAQSRCIQEWKKLEGEFKEAYHEVVITKTTRGQKNVCLLQNLASSLGHCPMDYLD